MIIACALAAWAAFYLAAARNARGWRGGRTAAFLTGLVALAAALLSPLHAAAAERLAPHMVQHLILLVVAPPLLVLGRPAAVFLRGGPEAVRRPLSRALHSHTAAVLTHPVTALAVFSTVLAGSHAPVLYNAALRHATLHDLEHLAYLCSALLFWQVVFAPDPHPHAASPLVRMLLVMAVMAPMAFVGVALLIPQHVVYPVYAAHPGALADQRLGGQIMWLAGTLSLAPALVAAGWWAVVREHRQRLALERAFERRGAG